MRQLVLVDTAHEDPTPRWMALAACRDPGVQRGDFFAEGVELSASLARGRAMAVCARCAVRDDCLEFVLSRPGEEFGIWGGTSERERRSLRRRRRAAMLDASRT